MKKRRRKGRNEIKKIKQKQRSEKRRRKEKKAKDCFFFQRAKINFDTIRVTYHFHFVRQPNLRREKQRNKNEKKDNKEEKKVHLSLIKEEEKGRKKEKNINFITTRETY